MKNEDKIVELLAETLQKQDRLAQMMERQVMVSDRILDVLVEMRTEQKQMGSEIKELNHLLRSEAIRRIEQLEAAVFKKGTTL